MSQKYVAVSDLVKKANVLNCSDDSLQQKGILLEPQTVCLSGS